MPLSRTVAHCRALAATGCIAWAVTTGAWAAGTIEAAQGSAAVTAPGETRSALPGTRVRRGETIALGDAGTLRVRLDDGAQLELRPGTRVTLFDIRADGGDDDRLALRLHRGGLRVLTGWIGRVTPAPLEIAVPSGSLRVRGSEIQVQTVDDGPQPGTLVFAADSVASIDTPAGSLQLLPGQAARLMPVGRPTLLAAVPDVFPDAADRAAEVYSAAQEARVRERLAQARRRLAFDGGVAASGERRISDDCTGSADGPTAFDEFVAAYESGNAAGVEQRLAFSLIGRQGVIDALIAESTRRRQLRFHFLDTQYQCGPDLTIINTSWEKRFIDGFTFTPGLQTGRVSVLLHREQGRWRLAAFSGDNPFVTALAGAGGQLARIAFGPVLSLADVGPVPAPAPVAIDVTDADLTGRGSIRVQVVSNRGDAENFTVPEVAPGRFLLPVLPLASGPPVPGDNALQVGAGTVLTLRYADLHPGNNRPATVLTATLAALGTTTVIDTTPDPFGFAAVTGVPPAIPVRSSSVTISGINAPATVIVSGGMVSIGGSAFVAAPAMISAGQTLQLQALSSAAPGAVVIATVTVGGVSAVFSVTTGGGAADTTPDAFSFRAASVAPNTTVDSSIAMITGINAPTPVRVTGGSISIGGGAYTTAPGPITAGQSLRVRGVAGAANGAVVNVTATVGGVAGVFTILTVADLTPDRFSLQPATPVVRCPSAGVPGVYNSAPVVITGINAAAPVSISPLGAATLARYSINGGPLTAAPGSLVNGQTLQAQVNVTCPAAGLLPTAPVANLSVGDFSVQFFAP